MFRLVEREEHGMAVRPGAIAIEVHHVFKTFRVNRNDHVNALRDIHFSIHEGEFVVLLGPSGCGKTTLLRIMGGLEPATEGGIAFPGGSGGVGDIGFVFQDATLMPWRSAQRNVEVPLEIAGVDRATRRERAAALLDLVGLHGFERKLPTQLSGGMRQRVSIARALAHDPPVLLMDEPFGALDAQTRESMNVELQRIWMESAKTVVFVTHSVEEAVFMADRIVLLDTHPGRIHSITPVDFPRPRRPALIRSAEFQELVAEIRDAIAAVGGGDDDLQRSEGAADVAN
jgi:NitT/TauT family transport system ATP-binding protein